MVDYIFNLFLQNILNLLLLCGATFFLITQWKKYYSGIKTRHLEENNTWGSKPQIVTGPRAVVFSLINLLFWILMVFIPFYYILRSF